MSSIEKVEELISRELGNKNVTIHPAVTKLLNKYKLELPSQYSYEELDKQYKDQISMSKKHKMSDDASEILHIVKRMKSSNENGIDLEKYSIVKFDQMGVDELGIIDSYMRYQELTLQELIPKTIINQWAINNDALTGQLDIVKQLELKEVNQLNQLNKYRDYMMTKKELEGHKQKKLWQDSVRNNLNL